MKKVYTIRRVKQPGDENVFDAFSIGSLDGRRKSIKQNPSQINSLLSPLGSNQDPD